MVGGSRILGGVVGGSIDAPFVSGLGHLFPAVLWGADLKVIGGALLTPAVALLTGKPDVRTLKALEGRTIGSGSVGALIYQLAVTLLKTNGVDVARANWASNCTIPTQRDRLVRGLAAHAKLYRFVQ